MAGVGDEVFFVPEALTALAETVGLAEAPVRLDDVGVKLRVFIHHTPPRITSTMMTAVQSLVIVCKNLKNSYRPLLNSNR